MERNTGAAEANNPQRSGPGGVPGVAESGICAARKSQVTVEGAARASRENQGTSYCSEGPRFSFPANMDADVRTGERRSDALSAGGTLSVPGFEDSELSAGDSSLPMVF